MGAKETWLRSVMAGICIAVGGAVNLSVDNKVVGAALFSTGLFTICTLGYYLYTGKVCYLLDSKGKIPSVVGSDLGRQPHWYCTGRLWTAPDPHRNSVGRKGTGLVSGKAERFAVEHLHPFGAV